ncbi:MAG TPA: hypothetical protein VK004_00300 [Ignavibacteria bacterium]|nr:hypothetical protein [Ignavibacteria bacterium]
MRIALPFITLLCLALFTLNSGSVEKSYSDDCPENTALTSVKNDKIDYENGFPHKYAYGNYNKTYNSYRAIFLNFDKSRDGDFRKPEGDEIKVVIMVFNMKGTELTEGEYTMDGGETGNQFSVGIETSEGSTYVTSLNGAEVGSVKINRIDEERICGEVDVNDSNGMKVIGSFSVKNEKVR